MQIDLLDVCSNYRILFSLTLSFVRGMGSIGATGGSLDGKATSTVIVFDLSLKRWQNTDNELKQPRNQHSSCQLDDRLYVIGGQDKKGKLTTTVEWLSLIDE